MHPHYTLHNGDAVEVLKDVHGGQVAAQHMLDLCGAIVVGLQAVVGKTATESGLDLDGGPDGDFKVAISKPEADELSQAE